MGYFPSEEEKPMAEEDLIQMMEDRSKQLDASKDANAALTWDADHRVNLKAEAAAICASAPGPEYIKDVFLTVNGHKGQQVPVNSLQWYMFRYTELLHDTLDVYEDPSAEPQVSMLDIARDNAGTPAEEISVWRYTVITCHF